MRFTKMHGLGNDYIYINGLKEKEQDWGAFAKAVSPAHTGIGSDGVIVILPSEKADFKMRMFNADGSEGEMCGNGIRCVGKYVYDKGLTQKEHLTIETGAGIKTLNLKQKNGRVDSVQVDMGVPVITGPKWINLKNGSRVWGFPVSMGNPHFVVFVPNVADYDVAGVGAEVECHTEFPNRTNVEFVERIDEHRLKMRVWERGSGETMACGTGACAAVVAAIAVRYCSDYARVELSGGYLDIMWPSGKGRLQMTGPAATVFEGRITRQQISQMKRYNERVHD